MHYVYGSCVWLLWHQTSCCYGYYLVSYCQLLQSDCWCGRECLKKRHGLVLFYKTHPSERVKQNYKFPRKADFVFCLERQVIHEFWLKVNENQVPQEVHRTSKGSNLVVIKIFLLRYTWNVTHSCPINIHVTTTQLKNVMWRLTWVKNVW